jgi:hypothetical protein
MARSSELSLLLRIFNQDFLRVSNFPHAHYMPRLNHTPWFDQPNNIWQEVQIIKLLVMQCSSLTYYFTLIRSTYSLKHPVLVLCKSHIVFAFACARGHRCNRSRRDVVWATWKVLYSSECTETNQWKPRQSPFWTRCGEFPGMMQKLCVRCYFPLVFLLLQKV